ncbi:unnamed protein product [Lymnaea stagnalis]|uniref:Uncharacterized protein n=1 Tax=Lymnaea stagnalis TaxID=6523 RepID=A0AAV2H394_LYMST
MQCFTLGHKYPRTTNGVQLKPPPPRYYKQRPRWIPEPSRNARPWVPEGVPYPPQFYTLRRLLVIPDDPPMHREKKMTEMLEAINVVNWTTSKEMKALGPRRSKFQDTLKYSTQSTQRHSYPGYWLGKELRRHPNRVASEGATPTTYHLVPYPRPKDHRLTIENYDTSGGPEDPSTRCRMFTVPHYVPDPYPGTPLPEGIQKPEEKPSTSKMHWIQ